MNIDDLIHHTAQWLKGAGPSSHIVMSTRIRLARNLAKVPFPNRAEKKDLLNVVEDVDKAIGQNEYFKNSVFLKMNELDSIDKQFLVERHLMSHEHAVSVYGKALIVSQEEQTNANASAN